MISKQFHYLFTRLHVLQPVTDSEPDRILAMVESIGELLAAKDVDGLVDLCSDDVVLVAPGIPVIQGKEGHLDVTAL